MKILTRKSAIRFGAAAGIILAAVLALMAVIRFSPYTALQSFKSHTISTRVYDVNGNLLQVLALEEGVRREFTSLEDIPEAVVQSFILAEDKRFFTHRGVDLSAVFRAAKSNAEEGRTVSGASTITMQLARIISPRKKRSLGAKCVEAWNALRLESRLSKNEILELYLNNVPFGFNTEGVTSAARYFFGKELIYLTPEEIEILSKIPRRPKSWESLAGNYEYPYEMPHYINYLKKDPKSGLFEKPEVQLSCSLEIQKIAEDFLASRTGMYAENRLTNGAVLAIDVKTGEVIVWAGSASFADEDHSGQIDGVLVPNQPGSSMKPFLYALALERGFEMTSVLPDVPMEFGFDALYVPQNFNNRYNGPVRFRVALASSLNIPAVYLLNKVGLEDYKERLYSLGFESLKNQDPGLSLALGSGEVTLKELVRAFAVFPRDGLDFEGRRIYKADTARLVCSMLSDKDARALGFGYSKVFQTDFDSMFKTGTANQFQNITALGASSRYAVGVWMGNFSGETVVGKTGSSIPAQIVHDILVMLENDGRPSESFRKPVVFEKVKICSLSGMAAGDSCGTTVSEYAEKSFVNQMEKCTWHRSGEVFYPEEYTAWFALKKRQGNVDYGSGSLRITSPREGSIFFYDDSFSMGNSQNLSVEVFGGSEETAELYVDGKSKGISERPFVFRLPLSRGEHLIEVFCGEESDSVSFTVN